MRADHAHAYLASLAPSTVRMGLERIRAALERLGHPEASFPAVHVAGTNGKGSTCAFLSSCLSQAYRVGFYSSPHLVRVNERFRIGGAEIDDETLGLRVGELLERLGPDHELTYFEFGTALAFWHFHRERVDLAVIETGLGGRLDATVLCRPIVTAITSIGLDHQELLGATLAQIAAEKAGIAKPGVPLVVARQPPEVMAVFERAQVPLIVEGRDVFFDAAAWPLSLKGAHQHLNAGVAVGVLRALAERGFSLTDAQVREGLSTARWPGRLEQLDGERTLLLDGAHNPAGVEALVDALERHWRGQAVRVVFGVFADKDSEPMMRRLFPRAVALHLTALHSPRSRPPRDYEALARTLCADVTTHEQTSDALFAALRTAGPTELVLVAGSFHLVGEARAVVENAFARLLETLEAFVPSDDAHDNLQRLSSGLPSGWPGLDPARFRDACFALFERFPDAELGTPGPLVHELERWPGYERALKASLARQPTFLTVSMANRFMNLASDEAVLLEWEGVLESVSQHPKAPEWVARAAARYRAHQRDRRGL